MIGIKKYYTSGYGLKFAEEDKFEEGCLPDTASSSSFDTSFEGESAGEVIEKICRYFDVELEDVELDACGEKGRVDVSVMENVEGYTATASELERWKVGKVQLWNCVYSFHVSKVTKEPVELNYRTLASGKRILV